MEQERKVVNIDDVKYYYDSLSDDAKRAATDISMIDTQIGNINMELRINSIARESLVKVLLEEIGSAEKVPEQEQEQENTENITFEN